MPRSSGRLKASFREWFPRKIDMFGFLKEKIKNAISKFKKTVEAEPEEKPICP